MKSPRLLCSLFEKTHSRLHFRSGHVRGPYHCNVSFITSCLLLFLSCSLQAGLLQVQSVFAFVLPKKMLLSQLVPITASVCLLCEVLRSSPWKIRCNLSITTLRSEKCGVFVHITKLLVVRQVGLIMCQTVCTGKKTRRGHFTLAGKTNVQSICGIKDGDEESVASVNCGVRICEVNDKPERVWHDRDVLFRTFKGRPASTQFLFNNQ